MTTQINVVDLITQEANSAGVPPNLALQIADQESGFDQGAVGTSGEIGVFQLLPSSFPGQDIGDVYTNVNLGVGYLSQLYQQFGSWPLALAAYNWGPTKLNKTLANGGSIPSTVQDYVNEALNAIGFTDDSSGDGSDGSLSSTPSLVPFLILAGVAVLAIALVD